MLSKSTNRMIVLLLSLFIAIVTVLLIMFAINREVIDVSEHELNWTRSRFADEELNSHAGIYLTDVVFCRETGMFSYRIVNNTAETIFLGRGVSLEKMAHGEWLTIPFVYGIFLDLIQMEMAVTSLDKNISITAWGYESGDAVPSGTYRIVREVLLPGRDSTGGLVWVYISSTIEITPN